MSSADLAADVAATERIAMSEPVFWQLIADLGGKVDEVGFERLVKALESCDLDGLMAWHARLTLVLFALDGPNFHQWYVENDPDQFGSVSDDIFLYARCDTVAAGEENWRTALRDGSLPWRRVVPGTGEYLLYAAAEAARSVGMSVEAFYTLAGERIPISFETGSNTDLW